MSAHLGRGGLALWIALRYLRRGRNRYARLINLITLAGLAVGVLVLTLVVSVMNGLAAELRNRLLGTVPHVLLTDASAADRAAAAAMPGVVAAHGFFRASGMVVGPGAMAPVKIHGLEQGTAQALPFLAEHMLDAELDDVLQASDGLVLGLPLARGLGLESGDDALLILPESVGGAVRPRFKRYRLRGVFELGAEFDHGLALVPRASFDAWERARLGQDGVRVVLDNPLRAEEFAAAWRQRPDAGAATPWTHAHGALFRAVRMEKAMMFLILLLVVAVAGFNIVSGQTMMIEDKRSDIAVLRTLGATGALLQRVFLLQGVVLATAGVALGLTLGVAAAPRIGPILAVVEAVLDFRLLEGTYFDVLPSRVQAADVAVIGGASWLLCLLAAWGPARRAAAQRPVDGLHP